MEMIMGKCNEIYEGFQSVNCMLDFSKKKKSILSKLERKWKPSQFELVRLYEIKKRDLDAPPWIKGTIKILEAISKKLAYME